jgi:predicted dehydrogenase
MAADGEPVHLASIGLGWWGNMLATAASQTATVAAAYARSADTRGAFAEKHGARAAADLDEIWADPDIDGVIIATPHSARTALIVAAAAAGKHVFVEKPLALTADEARACVAAVDEAGVVLQVGHNKRRQSGYRAIKAALDAGELGQIQHIETNISAPAAFNPELPDWRKRREDLPAGGMTPLGVHMIDTIHYFGGPIKRVMAMSRRVAQKLPVDDVTIMLFELDSGASAYLATLLASGPVNTAAVHGTDGNAYAEQDGTLLFRQKRGEPGRQQVPVEPIDTLAEEMAEFVDNIRGGRAPETGAPEALAVVEVLDAVVESAASGRAVDVR